MKVMRGGRIRGEMVTMDKRDFKALIDFMSEANPEAMARTDMDGLARVKKLPAVPLRRPELEKLIGKIGGSVAFDDAKREMTVKHGEKTLVITYE